MPTLNLTQHDATLDQIAAGVVEPDNKARVRQLLTFEEMPSFRDVLERAAALATIAKESGCAFAMIGGAPFFMAPLEDALEDVGVGPRYSFTRRESEEVPQGDGTVRKTQVFKHVGFLEPFPFDREALAEFREE